MTKYFVIAACIWLGFAVPMGLLDGKVLDSGSAASINKTIQPGIATAPNTSSSGIAPLRWITGTMNFLKGWLDVLTFNLSFLNDGWGLMFKWGIVILVMSPIMMGLVERGLGR